MQKKRDRGLASFKPTLTGIGRREGFFRRMFRGGPNLDRKKSKIIKNVKSKMKKSIGGRVKKVYFFVYIQV